MYRELQVEPRLTPFVACAWTSETEVGSHLVIPDGCVDLLFEAEQGTLSIVGTMSRALRVDGESDRQRFFGIRFKPGGAAVILRERVDAFTDRICADVVHDLVRDRIANAQDPLTAMQSYLSARILDTPEVRVARALQVLIRDPGARIERIAETLGTTRQHLRRLFLEHTGLSPKAFARIVRVRRFVRSKDASLARVAIDAGYAD